jgi:hypothetical protein
MQSSTSLFLGLLEPEDERTTILQNVGNDVLSDTAYHSRRLESSLPKCYVLFRILDGGQSPDAW